jgi:hypothetical protein
MSAHKAFEILSTTVSHLRDFESRLVVQKGLIEAAQHACTNGSLVGSYDWVQDLLNEFEQFLCSDATRGYSTRDLYTDGAEVEATLTALYRLNRLRCPE